MVGDVAEFIVGKGLCVEKTFSYFRFLGKFIQTFHIASESSGGKKADYAHYGGNSRHEPQKRIVGGKQLMERYRIGDSRSYHISVGCSG